MPCDHQFKQELQLQQLDYEPATLIVGTFLPSWPAPAVSGWFQGRTESNCFWDILPRLYGEASLIKASPAEWRDFCRDRQIAITDIISTIDDADPANTEHNKIMTGLADRAIAYNFDDFEFVSIVQLLQARPSIKNVYFTRSITEAFWRHLWNPVVQYASRNGLHERRLLSPSEDNSYQHAAYNAQQPANAILLPEDYMLLRWKEEWHQ